MANPNDANLREIKPFGWREWPQSPGIYLIFCRRNGRVYVGSSKDVRYRLRKHLESAKRNKHHNQHLQAVFNKYGEEGFVCLLIETCEMNNLIEREQHWIDMFDSANPKYGMNLNPKAESSLGRKYSEEERAKMKGRGKGRKVVFTETWRHNLSKAMKGKKPSNETRLKMSLAGKKRTFSSEHKKHISGALKGKKKDAAHVAKLKQNQGGENHPKTKLTQRDVNRIRELCKTARTTEIGRLYGVKPYVISQIKHGHTWKKTFCEPQ